MALAQATAGPPASPLPTRGMPGLEAWLHGAALAGGQPLGVYLVGLAAAALLAILLGRALPAWPADAAPPAAAPTRQQTWRMAARLALRLLVALGSLLLAGQLLGAMGPHLGAQGVIGRWDDAFSAAMAPQRSPALLAVFALLSHAGDALVLSFLGGAVAAGLWRAQHRLLAFAWAGALVGNGLLTRWFKASWARVRPAHEHGLAVVDGFSFPSGHASGSAVAYTWLACLGCWLLPARWRLPAAVAACGLAWTVAYSRVVLNVHHASDVLAGIAVGLTWTGASVLAAHSLLHWHGWRRGPAPTTPRQV